MLRYVTFWNGILARKWRMDFSFFEDRFLHGIGGNLARRFQPKSMHRPMISWQNPHKSGTSTNLRFGKIYRKPRRY